MGYSTSRAKARDNKELFHQIEMAIEDGRAISFKPSLNQTPTALEFQIRNALKSAQAYPEFGFDHLDDQVTVSQQGGQVTIKPRTKAIKAERTEEERGDSLVRFMGRLDSYSGTTLEDTFKMAPDDDITNIFEVIREKGWEIDGFQRDGLYVKMMVSRERPEPTGTPEGSASVSGEPIDPDSEEFEELWEKGVEEAKKKKEGDSGV